MIGFPADIWTRSLNLVRDKIWVQWSTVQKHLKLVLLLTIDYDYEIHPIPIFTGD